MKGNICAMRSGGVSSRIFSRDSSILRRGAPPSPRLEEAIFFRNPTRTERSGERVGSERQQKPCASKVRYCTRPTYLGSLVAEQRHVRNRVRDASAERARTPNPKECVPDGTPPLQRCVTPTYWIQRRRSRGASFLRQLPPTASGVNRKRHRSRGDRHLEEAPRHIKEIGAVPARDTTPIIL